MDQSIQRIFYSILKTEALLHTYHGGYMNICSGSCLAETSAGSPRKFIILIIFWKISRSKYSKNSLFEFDKQKHCDSYHVLNRTQYFVDPPFENCEFIPSNDTTLLKTKWLQRSEPHTGSAPIEHCWSIQTIRVTHKHHRTYGTVAVHITEYNCTSTMIQVYLEIVLNKHAYQPKACEKRQRANDVKALSHPSKIPNYCRHQRVPSY